MNDTDRTDNPLATDTPAAKETMASNQKLEVAQYLSAAFGGFLVGFGELLRGGSESTNVTVLRITAVLREQFSPSLDAGWIALVLLAVFSMILCSIYRPASRKESFALGLSVFAILSAFTPQQIPRSSAAVSDNRTDFLSFISVAAAAEQLENGQLGDYYFEFKSDGGRVRSQKGVMSVFDSSEKHLLLSVDIEVKKVSKLQLPKGNYVLQFECQGCSRVRAGLNVEKPVEAAKVTLNDSGVPLSFQRLFRASVVDIEDIPDNQLEGVLAKYRAQKQLE